MRKASVCPELNTLMYVVKLSDGEIRLYATDMIADNIWAQVYPDGKHYVTFESIIDHQVDNSLAVFNYIYWIINSSGTMQ